MRERRRRGWGEPAKGRGARSVETSSSMLGWASSNKLKKKILGRTPGHGPGGPGSKSAPAQKAVIRPLLHRLEELSRGFVEFKLVFASRNCNRVAYEGAKLVSRDNQVVEWHITPPALIMGADVG